MKKEVILVGYFCEAIELCEKAGYTIVGIIDNQDPRDNRFCYLGDDDSVLEHKDKYNSIPLFMVPDAPGLREKLYDKYHNKGFKFETIISPNALISSSAIIGEGCMIQDGCNISANVKLGKMVRVNSMSNIMHDSEVSEFSIIAPSSVVLGRCCIGRCVYIGANATILPNLSVGDNAVVGAGAVVTKNVDKSVTVVGVPAKALRK